MTYGGQFIASAKRIRGIGSGIYSELLEALTNGDSWAHDPERMGMETEKLGDSLERPNFGFTTERTWALLLQCAEEGRIMTRCPSLLSGRWMSGEVEDCQCLDE